MKAFVISPQFGESIGFYPRETNYTKSSHTAPWAMFCEVSFVLFNIHPHHWYLTVTTAKDE